jgi:hypothetical protein
VDSRLGGTRHPDGERLLRAPSGKLIGIKLQPWEMLDLVLLEHAFVTPDARHRQPGYPDWGRDG